MPPKIRQLKASLSKAGFYVRPGRGSHTVWYHPDMLDIEITLAGHDGHDAKVYQVKDVQGALKNLERRRRER